MIPVITVSIPTYEIFSTIGAISAVILLYFRLEDYSIKFLQFLKYMLFAVAFLLIGSRLLFVMTYLTEIRSFGDLIFYILNGGIVFYGGLLGAIFGIWLCAKIRREDVGVFYNFCTPAFPLFHFWGRIGCFFAGCCYGIESHFGFPMAFDPEVTRFPVQLTESACNLLIFTSLMLVSKYNKKTNLLRLYLIEYSVVRFILEFFRGDNVRGIWGGLSTSQIISMLIFAVEMLSIIKQRRLKKESD